MACATSTAAATRNRLVAMPGPSARGRGDRRFQVKTPSPEAAIATSPAATCSAPCWPANCRRSRCADRRQPGVRARFRSRREIHARSWRRATAGPPCCWSSEDLDELLELADRIAVMFEGIVHETPTASADMRIGRSWPATHHVSEAPRGRSSETSTTEAAMTRSASSPRILRLRFPTAKTAVVVIDMQRDFVEPGGFGESLGNNVRLLLRRDRAHAATARWLPRRWHDYPHRDATAPTWPIARRRNDARQPDLRIGDPAAMGRILIDGEQGTDFVPELAPQRGEIVIVKPGKGPFCPRRWATSCARRTSPTSVRRRHHRGVRADHHARGQRPGLREPAHRGRPRKATSRSSSDAAIDMIRDAAPSWDGTAPSAAILAAIQRVG